MKDKQVPMKDRASEGISQWMVCETWQVLNFILFLGRRIRVSRDGLKKHHPIVLAIFFFLKENSFLSLPSTLCASCGVYTSALKYHSY